MTVLPTKFLYVRHLLPVSGLRILDIGCGNNSPTITKHWFPRCHYTGADIQRYNNNDDDLKAMDEFHLLGADGSGYAAIPDYSFDLVILHHVIELTHEGSQTGARSGLSQGEAGRLYLGSIPFIAKFVIAARLAGDAAVLR